MRRGSREALQLAAAFALDRLLGDPVRWHPVAGFGELAEALERHTWRPRRSAGIGHVAILLAGAHFTGRLARRNPALATIAIWSTLGGRSLEQAALRMATLLHAGQLAAAREHAASLMGRDTSELDTGELCRATIESVAENTADALVGALLWAALAGTPGATAYRAANTLDAMIGHRTVRYRRFGWAAARLDDVMTWPAARLTALLSVLLAPLAGADGAGALRVLRRDGARHPSPNAGPVEAAFAGAIGVRLGGLNHYAAGPERRPTLGDGREPVVEDIAAAVRLSRVVGRAGLALCLLLTLARPA